MNILFATDLTEPEALTRRVQEYVQRLHGRLMVLHVVADAPTSAAGAFDPIGGLAGFAPYTAFDPELQRDLEQAEAREFERFLRERFTIPVLPAIRVGMPVDVIIEDAEMNGVDLIIVGKHSHSRLERLFLGSVASDLIRRVNRPTLVMPVEPVSGQQ